MRTGLKWAIPGVVAVTTALGVGLVGATGSSPSGDRSTFVPTAPCRLMDTRASDQVGPRNTPLGADDTYAVGVRGASGNCLLPSDATGLLLNVTAIGATAPTFVVLWPSGEDRPVASHLNPAPGQAPTPNAVTTAVGDDGTISLYNFAGAVDVIVDVGGYYVDHDHDDRYYPRAEVDALIDAVEGTPGPAGPPGETGPFDGTDIVDDSLSAADVVDEPGIAISTVELMNTHAGTGNKVISLVTIETPASGIVRVESSGLMQATGLYCSIIESGGGVSFDTDKLVWFNDNYTGSFHVTNSFDVDAGTHSFALVCTDYGLADTSYFEIAEFVAMYFPTSYAFSP